jgi:hypothetical protein
LEKKCTHCIGVNTLVVEEEQTDRQIDERRKNEEEENKRRKMNGGSKTNNDVSVLGGRVFDSTAQAYYAVCRKAEGVWGGGAGGEASKVARSPGGRTAPLYS